MPPSVLLLLVTAVTFSKIQGWWTLGCFACRSNHSTQSSVSQCTRKDWKGKHKLLGAASIKLIGIYETKSNFSLLSFWGFLICTIFLERWLFCIFTCNSVTLSYAFLAFYDLKSCLWPFYYYYFYFYVSLGQFS